MICAAGDGPSKCPQFGAIMNNAAMTFLDMCLMEIWTCLSRVYTSEWGKDQSGDYNWYLTVI